MTLKIYVSLSPPSPLLALWINTMLCPIMFDSITIELTCTLLVIVVSVLRDYPLFMKQQK